MKMSRSRAGSVLSLLCLATLLAGNMLAAGLGPGSEVPDFTVKTVDGQDVSFTSLAGDVTVVTFVATQCPVSNAYNERMSPSMPTISGRTSSSSSSTPTVRRTLPE